MPVVHYDTLIFFFRNHQLGSTPNFKKKIVFMDFMEQKTKEKSCYKTKTKVYVFYKN